MERSRWSLQMKQRKAEDVFRAVSIFLAMSADGLLLIRFHTIQVRMVAIRDARSQYG